MSMGATASPAALRRSAACAACSAAGASRWASASGSQQRRLVGAHVLGHGDEGSSSSSLWLPGPSGNRGGWERARGVHHEASSWSRSVDGVGVRRTRHQRNADAGRRASGRLQGLRDGEVVVPVASMPGMRGDVLAPSRRNTSVGQRAGRRAACCGLPRPRGDHGQAEAPGERPRAARSSTTATSGPRGKRTGSPARNSIAGRPAGRREASTQAWRG